MDNRRDSGGFRRGGGFNRGGFGGGRGGGFRRSFGGPREMHKAVCAECKKDCEVPFKPTEGKPVYCKECYFKRKDAERNGGAPRQESKPEVESEAEESEEEM